MLKKFVGSLWLVGDLWAKLVDAHRTLIGGLFAYMADFAFGLIIAKILGGVFHRPTPGWLYLVAGAIGAIGFDADTYLQRLREKVVDSRHKKIGFHYPLVALPSIFILLAVFSSWFWVVLVVLCLLVHLLHDSWGWANRWGVRWLYPLSPHYYWLWGRKGGKEDGEKQALAVLTPEGVAQLTSVSLDVWLEENYLQLTGETVFAIFALMVALLIVL